MQNKIDWKDIASSYYDKCLSLTILFVIFVFMVFPDVELQNLRTTERIMETIEIPDEILERIEPPEDIARPIVNIEIIDDEDTSDDEIEYIDTIGITRLDPLVAVAPPQHGETPRFVIFEEAPVILSRPRPVYPEAFLSARITGEVVLNIEVLSDGSIGAIEVVSSLLPGPGGFDEAAISAVRQWQIQPAKNMGNPVACWIRQTVRFTF